MAAQIRTETKKIEPPDEGEIVTPPLNDGELVIQRGADLSR
jgi:hypothetical protein